MVSNSEEMNCRPVSAWGFKMWAVERLFLVSYSTILPYIVVRIKRRGKKISSLELIVYSISLAKSKADRNRNTQRSSGFVMIVPILGLGDIPRSTACCWWRSWIESEAEDEPPMFLFYSTVVVCLIRFLCIQPGLVLLVFLYRFPLLLYLVEKVLAARLDCVRASPRTFSHRLLAS